MAIVSWNVRGINGEDSLRQTKLLLKVHKPDLLFLMETKCPEGKVDFMCKYLSFDYGFEEPRSGMSGGLMLLWKESVEITYLTSSSNHVS